MRITFEREHSIKPPRVVNSLKENEEALQSISEHSLACGRRLNLSQAWEHATFTHSSLYVFSRSSSRIIENCYQISSRIFHPTVECYNNRFEVQWRGHVLIAFQRIIDTPCGIHKQTNLILINERSNRAVIFQLEKSAGSSRKIYKNAWHWQWDFVESNLLKKY